VRADNAGLMKYPSGTPILLVDLRETVDDLA
jgi:hypothetical protein